MLLGVKEYTKNDAVSWAIPWNKDVTGMDVLKIQAGI